MGVCSVRSDLIIAQVRRRAQVVLLLALGVAVSGFSTAQAEPEGLFHPLGLMLGAAGAAPNAAVSIGQSTTSRPAANGAAIAAALAQRMANRNDANPDFVSLGAFPGGEMSFSQALDGTRGGPAGGGDSIRHLGQASGTVAGRWTSASGRGGV